MISIKNLSYSYHDNQILNNISLDIEKGDYLAILGKNGTGKSTLMKCLIGINKTGGNIFIDDEDISKKKDFSSIGYVEQNGVILNDFPITVEEYLRIFSDEYKSVLNFLNIENLSSKNINSLSGGENQKVKIAKELTNKQLKYLFLDEPTAGVDKASIKEINDIFYKLNQEGLTIVVITHDFEEIDCHAQKIFWIDKNQIEVLNKNTSECDNCNGGEKDD